MLDSPLPGFEPPSPPELRITPALVSAAYKRVLRLGAFWRLKPEERAILTLARRLRAIKSPVLREHILEILEKIWPEKHQAIQAVELGAKLLAHKLNLALKIGALSVAQALTAAASLLAPQLGYAYLNTPLFYRPKVDDARETSP